MMTILTTCPWCHEDNEVSVPFEGWLSYQMGALVQDAFPDLSASDREMLISGICPKCWRAMLCISLPTENDWDDEDDWDKDEDEW